MFLSFQGQGVHGLRAIVTRHGFLGLKPLNTVPVNFMKGFIAPVIFNFKNVFESCAFKMNAEFEAGEKNRHHPEVKRHRGICYTVTFNTGATAALFLLLARCSALKLLSSPPTGDGVSNCQLSSPSPPHLSLLRHSVHNEALLGDEKESERLPLEAHRSAWLLRPSLLTLT